MEIGYYPGCTLKQSSGLYDIQTRSIMNALGVHLHELKDWNCCGATSAAKVDDFLAIAMPARNLGIADQMGLTEMVIPCSACYSKTLVARHRLLDDPDLTHTINKDLARKITGKTKIVSILEVLLSFYRSGDLAKHIVKKCKGLTPVCYYGCMMTRFPYPVPISDDVENPQSMEIILKAIGIQSVDWNDKTSCCGASATINDKETSLSLMAQIMKDALKSGANCFVVSCPMCQLNLDAYQNEFCEMNDIQERLPVYFITELLGLSMGMSLKNLQVNRHFIDGIGLLKELELL